jgi:hypothetical protein
MTEIEKAILKTIIYADIFDYPLTAEEIYKYLIVDEEYPHPRGVSSLHPGGEKPGVSITFNTVAAMISELQEKQLICYADGLYMLAGKQKLATLRRRREKASRAKMLLAENLAQKLIKIPYVLGVFVTGALSMQNTDENEDIDLMIITKRNRLWTTRLLVTTYLEWKGIRRRPIPHPRGVKDKFCVNMYLDESALAVPENMQNLYTAHEIVQVKPLIHRGQIYERFLTANRWAKDYLPQAIKWDTSHAEPKVLTKQGIGENIAFQIQAIYMKFRMTRESISPHAAFFHPRDTSSQVLKQYNKSLDKIRL